MNEEIKENNKLILKFVGRRGRVNNHLYTFPGLYDLIQDTWVTLEDTKFHLSLDWLMPVVNKIEDIEEEEGFIDVIETQKKQGDKVDMVYNAVVEYINRRNDEICYS